MMDFWKSAITAACVLGAGAAVAWIITQEEEADNATESTQVERDTPARVSKSGTESLGARLAAAVKTIHENRVPNKSNTSALTNALATCQMASAYSSGQEVLIQFGLIELLVNLISYQETALDAAILLSNLVNHTSGRDILTMPPREQTSSIPLISTLADQLAVSLQEAGSLEVAEFILTTFMNFNVMDQYHVYMFTLSPQVFQTLISLLNDPYLPRGLKSKALKVLVNISVDSMSASLLASDPTFLPGFVRFLRQESITPLKAILDSTIRQQSLRLLLNMLYTQHLFDACASSTYLVQPSNPKHIRRTTENDDSSNDDAESDSPALSQQSWTTVLDKERDILERLGESCDNDDVPRLIEEIFNLLGTSSCSNQPSDEAQNVIDRVI